MKLQNMVKLVAVSNMKYEGGPEMKGNYEQMTQWVEELKNPISNLMGRLELYQEDMALDCYHHLCGSFACTREIYFPVGNLYCLQTD